MIKPEKIWQKFVNEIENLPLNMTKSDYYKFISQWIKQNQEAIGKDKIKRYGLLELSEIDPDNYALEKSDSDGFFLRNRIKEISPKSADVISMFIRDDLESLIVYKVARKCIVCRGVEMQVWKYTEKDVTQILYQCELCFYAEFQNGEPYKNGKAVIATKFDLISEGII